MKIHLLFLALCFCFFSINSIAQIDTIYFNKDWDTCAINEAYYIRILKKDLKGFAVVDYYLNGKIKTIGAYDIDSPTNKQGYFKNFDEDGFIESEGNYVNNKSEGLHKSYKAKGALWLERELTNGKNNGELKTYFTTGTIKRIEHYNNGVFVDGKCFATTGSDTTFYPYEEMPEFIGGETALYKFLEKNVKYPKAARKAYVEGTVRVRFVVDTDGTVTDIKVKKQGNKYLDEEAIRVVSLSPRWKPGKIEGKEVKVYYAIPIKFLLR